MSEKIKRIKRLKNYCEEVNKKRNYIPLYKKQYNKLLEKYKEERG